MKLARTFRMLGDEGRGTECLAEAVTLVNRRRDDIRDEELRARYLALSNVRSIHELGA